MIDSYTLSINSTRYYHQIHTTEITIPLDFLAFLEKQPGFPKCYWQSADKEFECAAWGSFFELESPPTFKSDHDSPARFWGGHAFFPFSTSKDPLWKTFPRSVFFLPKFELIREKGKTKLLTHGLNHSPLDPPLMTPEFFDQNRVSRKNRKDLPSKEHWDHVLENSLRKIEQKIFDKVVLARRTSFSFDEDVNGYKLLSELKIPRATRFAFQFAKEQLFIGTSPERLFRRVGRTIYTEAVAGTRPKGLEKELWDSPKEKHEFNLVKVSIKNGLEPLCEQLKEEQDSILEMPNVSHLHCHFTGKLHPGIYDGELLAALHPTAAVGGAPRNSSLQHLLSGEPFERGWYSSPLGYTSKTTAEFVVGIRSALVDQKEVHLFAGVGIVEGSKADSEWEELNQKMEIWEKYLT